MPDIGQSLGSNLPSGSMQFTLFIPSVDRDERPIDQEYWREEALKTFGALFRGATAFPPGRGVWRDDPTGELVFDDTVLVTSYADPAAVTEEALSVLRAFLHKMGREARQGEIGLVVDGCYYGISQFDDPLGKGES